MKTVLRSKVVPSSGRIKVKILVFSSADSTGGASTRSSITHDDLIQKLDDDGALTDSTRSLPGQNGTSYS